MSNPHFVNRLLTGISNLGEHYGAILGGGLTLLAAGMLYGYLSDRHDILMFSFWATLLFVFGPPAALMSSFLLTKLFGALKSRRKTDPS